MLISGVIKNGGAKANVIPELTALEYYIRAPTMNDVNEVKAKVIKCFEAAAMATGCEVRLILDSIGVKYNKYYVDDGWQGVQYNFFESV